MLGQEEIAGLKALQRFLRAGNVCQDAAQDGAFGSLGVWQRFVSDESAKFLHGASILRRAGGRSDAQFLILKRLAHFGRAPP